MAISEQTHDQPKETVELICSACDGTGKRGHEEGPPGATWTVYEKCRHCKDGRVTRRI